MFRKCVLLVVGFGFLAAAAGCSRSIPAAPGGVLSAIHQKSLEFAAQKALDQAEVSSERFGTKKLCLRFQNVQDTDLGKQHVVRVVTDEFRKVSAGVVETNDGKAESLECQILMAGVDISNGDFLGFSWIDTKGEVTLRLRYNGEGGPVEKEGAGMAVYHQSWWLGLGPSESWKK